MVVYFLYREIELINIHFKHEIFLIKEQLLKLNKHNVLINENFNQELEVELNVNTDTDTVPDAHIKLEEDKVINISIEPVEEYSNEMIYSNTPDKINQESLDTNIDTNIVTNIVTDTNIVTVDPIDPNVTIDTNIGTNIVTISTNNDSNDTNIDLLLKNKLNELQALANELNINITQNGKKKTKIQLAQEIYSIKKKNI